MRPPVEDRRGRKTTTGARTGGGRRRPAALALRAAPTVVVAAVLLAASAASSGGTLPVVYADGGGGNDLAPPLTDDETALLAELSSISAEIDDDDDSSADDGGGGGPLAPPPSLSSLASTLTARIDAASDVADRSVQFLTNAAPNLAKRREELVARTRKLEEDVRRRNAEELRTLRSRLNVTLGEELRRRDVMDAARKEAEEEAANAGSVAGIGGGEESRELEIAVEKAAERARRKKERQEKDRARKREKERAARPPIVTVDDLEKALDRDDIMGPSEADLKRRVSDLAREDFANRAAAERTKLEERRKSREDRAQCVDPRAAGSLVVADLARHASDGVGRYDFAASENGGSIAYALGGVYTSEPYDPRDDLGYERVGEAEWRRYIPEDWEAILPWGWERWRVPAEGWRGFIPSYVWTSLGLKSSPVQPPESALNSNTNVGSCYPLPGRSGGRLTVRLPAPVRVDSVTIDHVPSILGGEQGRSSAVRYFKVIGYAPCKKNIDDQREREECENVGFDSSRSFDLGEYEYKIVPSKKLDQEGNSPGGRSVQTFDVTAALERAAELVEDDDDFEEEEEESKDEEEEEEEGDPGMCTMEKAASCGGPGAKKKRPIQAVTIEVEDNWGAEDYTCLYRFRVHGESVSA